MCMRAAANADSRPMVGPLSAAGINATQTQLAIDDLPAEVTLSFALDSKRLDYWIKTARADGHEVLIEVPMEAYDYGRMKMHPDTLLAAADAKSNLARLDTILSRTSGYFGVVNYQGAKFAANTEASGAVLQRLVERGWPLLMMAASNVPALHRRRASGARYARATADRYAPTHAEISAELMIRNAGAERRAFGGHLP